MGRVKGGRGIYGHKARGQVSFRLGVPYRRAAASSVEQRSLLAASALGKEFHVETVYRMRISTYICMGATLRTIAIRSRDAGRI